MYSHKNNNNDKQKQGSYNGSAVVLNKLPHAGQGMDIAFQHIIIDCPGIYREKGFI